MKVVLAGYNVDKEVIDDLKRHSPPRNDVTPETLSAAYARISRDPRPADELRAVARREVERARRSNRTIIFKMGHHSVAEHAVFNFDIIGVSRLALEEIERFRLCSYTEKSQRYILLGDDFVIPEEVRKERLQRVFMKTIRAQNALYHSLYARLKPHLFIKYKDLAQESRNHPVLEGWAKEDARYVVSLATEGQVGLTINARNLELLLRRFAARKSAELRELNQRIYRLAKEVAPSIILFTEASDFDARTYGELEDAAATLLERTRGRPKRESRAVRKDEESVSLADATPGGDDRILAAILHTSGSTPYEQGLRRVRWMTPAEKRDLIKTAIRRQEFYDFPLREFEYADLTFSLIVSASCFAQLKRHRMATLTCQRYDPSLGVTVPPAVGEVGALPEFRRMAAQTEETHARLQKKIGPEAAAYVLMNAHRRRVLFKVNVRELYHISRLREDPTAQWEIREVAGRMSALARKEMPFSGLLLGGKEQYPSLYRKVFGKEPGLSPPKLLK
ncbi:MAG: FAD-dependent thymidylate synthase [Candidatus Aminicenantes bacterium]|nr:FAD-dependent thymidylate synthase [Candidatus Aminicenantes bacterium]